MKGQIAMVRASVAAGFCLVLSVQVGARALLASGPTQVHPTSEDPPVDLVTPDFAAVLVDPDWTVVARPSYQQTLDYSCGAAVAMTAATHFGKMLASDWTAATETTVSREIGANQWVGAMPWRLRSWLVAKGMAGENDRDGSLDEIVARLQQGELTAVAWSAWGGHWSIVIGYNKRLKKVALSDPADVTDDRRDGVTYLDEAVFLNNWYTPPATMLTSGIYVTIPRPLQQRVIPN